MVHPPRIKRDFIADFGEGYLSFGFSRLMGHVVGLLLYEDRPLSLDDITEQLQVSKGPVSQITRRLAEKGLLRKVWVPGSRKTHYQAEDDIFGRAYANHARKQAQNLDLAHRYQRLLEKRGRSAPDYFHRRVEEMARFYELMDEQMRDFMERWKRERDRLAAPSR